MSEINNEYAEKEWQDKLSRARELLSSCQSKAKMLSSTNEFNGTIKYSLLFRVPKTEIDAIRWENPFHGQTSARSITDCCNDPTQQLKGGFSYGKFRYDRRFIVD